ncbi:hypothetical protein PI126_g14072 [Phytophthora idaei]|nr:hypothetical protein PI126_g14072 [Phytophthora idaei]
MTEDPSKTQTASRNAMVVHVFDVGALFRAVLLDARDLLDGLLEIQPSFSNYLEPNADIVHSSDFESGVVKVLSGQVKRLSHGERSALQPLKMAAKPSASAPEPAKMGFADRILKKRKTESTPCASARMVLRYERNRLSPFTLEMILFLRVNETYCDVTTVDACI